MDFAKGFTKGMSNDFFRLLIVYIRKFIRATAIRAEKDDTRALNWPLEGNRAVYPVHPPGGHPKKDF